MHESKSVVLDILVAPVMTAAFHYHPFLDMLVTPIVVAALNYIFVAPVVGAVFNLAPCMMHTPLL